jgi:hypothetical protein
MRYVLGFLSGVLGGLAGWAGLAFLTVALSGPPGPGDEGAMAMGAFFDIGPIGGLIGFVAGAWLFFRFGVARQSKRISRPVAAAVVAVCGLLAFWGWWEFIRSPYLSHGDQAMMSLRMQFRLASGAALPDDAKGVVVSADDGDGRATASLTPNWRGRDGERAVILAAVELEQKTYGRTARLELPGQAPRVWRLGLASDPYPQPEFSPWRAADEGAGPTIEMRFRLTADRCASCDD